MSENTRVKRKAKRRTSQSGKLDHDPVLCDEIVHRPIDSVKPSPENDKLYRPVDPSDPEIVDLAKSIGERGIEEPLNVGRFGRVSNNISNLKRELRHSLRVDGSRLVSVDLKNAQPGFLGAAVKEEEERQARDRRGNGTKEGKYDAQLRLSNALFSKLVESGCLYEYLLEDLRRRSIRMSREKLKRKVLADVIAKKRVGKRGVEYPSVVEDVFKELFPGVYRYIRAVNEDGRHHENLIRELQRRESSFVIGTVAADLMIRHPKLFFITLHDAIFTIPDGVPLVQLAFGRGFEATGLRMALKVGEN